VNYAISEELKAHFDYKPGSYWIYRDSITGDTDSFVVVTNTFVPAVEKTNTGTTEDQVVIDVFSYNTTTNVRDSLGFGIILYQNSFKVLTSLQTQDHNVEYNPLFNYPFSVGAVPYGNGCEVLSILPSFTVNGNTYVNVAEVKHFVGDSSPRSHNDLMYINTDAGIIRWRMNRSTIYNKVWELQRYHINR
jgi:hypothetical protein